MAVKGEKEVASKGVTKSERIEEIRKKLEKDFGKGTLIGANDKATFHDYIPTGSLGLDKALGIGGLPRGRIVEIIGPESSGKTTLAIHTIAEAHKTPDVYCGYVDVEHAFDVAYAQALGVDLNRLEISQPDYGEQALEVAERLAESGDFDVVVIDSVAALVPKAETERDMGESSMGKQAMLMGQAMRKLTPVAAKSNTLLIFINQIREKIGVMFGSPETTPGGNALKFYASIRLDIRRYISKDNMVMDGDTKLGNNVKVKVIKNKTAPPFRECEFDILYGEGIDKYGELLDMAVKCDIVTKKGTYFNYQDTTLGQGRDKAVAFLKSDDKLFEDIKIRVIQSYTPGNFEPEEVINEKANK